MSKIRPLQRSFSSGEISPRFLSRPDLSFYAQSLKSLINWVITPQGTVVKRNGSELIAEVSNTLTYGRIFTVRVEGSKAYTILVTEDEVTLFGLQGTVTESNELVNGEFDENLDFWNRNFITVPGKFLTEFPSITWVSGSVSIRSGNAAQVDLDVIPGEFFDRVNIEPCSAELTQQLTGMTGSNLHSLILTIVPGTYLATGVLFDHLSIGTTEGASDISFTVDPMDSSRITFTPGAASFWISYKLAWDDSLDPSEPGLIEHGVGVGNIGTSASVRFDSIVLEDEVTTAGATTFASPWTEDEIRELQTEKAPGLNTLYFTVRSPTATQKMEYFPASNTWFFGAVTFSNPPATWAADGYPGSITFHQGRMELCGTISHPITTWLSKAGEDNFEDFDFGTGLDDEALELPLARDGIIQWTQGGKALFIGSDFAEHSIIGETDQAPITPSNVDGPQQSSYGSARIHGRWLSDKVVYVSNDQRRIYAMQYSRNARQYLSDELTYKSEHITEELVVELKVGQDPRQHIWCVLKDGSLAGCTFQPEAETVGWYRYNMLFGDVISSTIMRQNGASKLWILVLRNNILYIEREGAEQMDSHLIRDYATDTTVIDGLEHLESVAVQVKSNGAYAGTYTVNGGQVTVHDQFASRTFAVGIPVNSTLVTLPVDLINQTDTLASKLLRWSKIYVRMSGLRPFVNGVAPPDRTYTTPMDSPEIDIENMDISGTLGRDREGNITLTQNLPFETEIHGLFGELQQEGL